MEAHLNNTSTVGSCEFTRFKWSQILDRVDMLVKSFRKHNKAIHRFAKTQTCLLNKTTNRRF